MPRFFNSFSTSIQTALLLALLIGGGAQAQKRYAKARFEPDDQTVVRDERWQLVSPGLHGLFASLDRRYPRHAEPRLTTTKKWRGTAWRGERVHTKLLLWSANGARQTHLRSSELKTDDGKTLKNAHIETRFVRYVLADPANGKCGYRDGLPTSLEPDMLDNIERLDIPAQSARPVWLTIDVPADANPGVYQGVVSVLSEANSPLTFEVELEVSPMTLPSPSEWSFHLDLWQDPWSVARFHDVKPWSNEHWQLLKPLIKTLAEAGQKCITTSLVHEPWGGQTYHDYQAMIEWTKQKNGEWIYDFSVFEKWVEFCLEQGITEQINCYSMVPWSNSFRYFDEATGLYKYVRAEAGSEAFVEHWRPFLTEFAKFLDNRGWLEKTCIAMDERGLDAMKAVIKLVKDVSPKLKIVLAGNYHEEIDGDIYDFSPQISQTMPEGVLAKRKAEGLHTTFYTSCSNRFPNSFTASPPADAALIGWFAAANGYTGFLRWAYNSWPANPLYDSRFVTWSAGDTFLIYPGARSSVRFERLREGFQDFEKLRILQEALGAEGNESVRKELDALATLFEEFKYKNIQSYGASADLVNQGKALLKTLSRAANELKKS